MVKNVNLLDFERGQEHDNCGYAVAFQAIALFLLGWKNGTKRNYLNGKQCETQANIKRLNAHLITLMIQFSSDAQTIRGLVL